MSDDNSASLSPSVINIALSAVTAFLLLLVAWGVAEGNVTASMLAGAGLAVVIVAFGTINLVPDTMRAEGNREDPCHCLRDPSQLQPWPHAR